MPSPMVRRHRTAKRAPPDTARKNSHKLVLKKSKPVLNADSDDHVEEYNFENEASDSRDEGEEEDDAVELDDGRSVITVSSDVPDDADVRPSDRPWLHFNVEQRVQWEHMYASVARMPMDGSWEVTEDYQRERDIEMLRYMEDYPLQAWAIPKQDAEQAYYHLLERSRWRSLGIRIYGREPVPDWAPGIVGGDRTQQTPPFPPSQGQGHSTPPLPLDQNQAPLPLHVLPSQSHAQPILVHHSTQLGRPALLPQGTNVTIHPLPHANTINMGQVPGFSVPDSSRTRKTRERKEPLSASSPPPPPPTPPYPELKKPAEPNAPNRPGRKSLRKHAEGEGFPWTRQIDFRGAKARATWDDSIYDPATIMQMEAIRMRNMPIIAQIDVKIIEQQRESMRLARAAKKRAAAVAAGERLQTPEQDTSRRKGGRKKDGGKVKCEGGNVSDPYHSGQFCFATPHEEAKAGSLGIDNPGEIVDKTEAGEIDLQASGGIKICWNPGKRALAENLEQVVFSIRDTVLTRRQLAGMPILTRRAAECVIDFCPDMLWRNLLLRIASEAGYGNKDVRDRFCWNGCYCDKATITKRISAALGQKQTQAKSKGYGPGELDWYNHNVKTFSHYIDFFGKRTGHRNWTKILSNAAEERKGENGGEGQVKTSSAAEEDQEDEDDNSAVELLGSSNGQDLSDDQSMKGSAAKKTGLVLENADEEIGNGSEGSDDDQAASAQDSDAMDAMDAA